MHLSRENKGRGHCFEFDHVDIRLGSHLLFSVIKHNCLQELYYFLLKVAAVFVVVPVGGGSFLHD